MDTMFKHITLYLATGAELCATLIIGLAVCQAVYRSMHLFFEGNSEEASQDSIRIRLGRWLSLGLEFELAADILLTAVAPTWDEIGKLASIIVLRTVLNYFLQREIDVVGREHDLVLRPNQQTK